MKRWSEYNYGKWRLRKRNIGNAAYMLFAIGIVLALTGCGQKEIEKQNAEDVELIDAATREATGIANETAKDGKIDFEALKAENEEIFAWLYIPDTNIDVPILQSWESDDFYENHNAYGEADESGAAYIEAANLNSMCDFNTVIHGKAEVNCQEGIFADLNSFANPDFFDGHEQLYIYLEDNVLTYEVFAAYERENNSLIRTYDFTYLDGCQQFLTDLYNTREMSMNIRTGWDEVTPYHFLVTLTIQKESSSDKQYVVVAALIEDAAGTIDRVVLE